MVCIVPLLRLDGQELSESQERFQNQKREATEWEHHFRMKEAADLDMTFGEFVQAYTKGYEAEAETQYLADKGAYLTHKTITVL